MFSIEFLTHDPALINTVRHFIEEWKNEKPIIKVKTSGSTGPPKTVNIQKQFMKSSARMTGDFLGLQEDETALLCLSPETIAGKMMIVRSIELGLKLFVADITSDPLKDISLSFDFTAMVPLQVKRILTESPGKLTSIRSLIIGGASIPPDLFEEIAKVHPNAFQTFGMTETISHIAMRRIISPAPAYQTMPGVTVDSIENLLIVHAPDLGIDSLQTNDLVDVLNPEEFYWKGRADFVINSGGVKIHPEVIEEKLGSIITSPFFISKLPDELLGERMILCLEGKHFFVKEDFRKLLASHYIPKEIYFFKKFHYTQSGKIDRITTLQQIKDAEKKVL